MKIGRPSKYSGPFTPAVTWQQLKQSLAAKASGNNADTVTESTNKSEDAIISEDICRLKDEDFLIAVDPDTKMYRELFVGMMAFICGRKLIYLILF